MNPKISIIIPAYNIERYIKRALDSCINQTLGDIEIIVVDDCGSDSSIEIAKSYAKRDSRIRIIHNPKNLGTFNARLQGINNAKGEYLLFLDGDDYLDLKACELAYKASLDAIESAESLESNPKNPKDLTHSTKPPHSIDSPDSKPDIIFFGMRHYPPTWKRTTPPVLTKSLRNEEILKAVFAHCATPPWHIWAKLYKASHIMRVCDLLVAHMGDFERLNMAEDSLKSFIIMALAKSSKGIDDKLYIYCDNKGSITRRIDLNSTKKKIDDLSRVIDYLDEFAKIDEVRNHKYFQIAKNKTQNILRATRELEYRYLSPSDINAIRGGAAKRCVTLPIYLECCIKSMRYHRKWQTYARILAYILTLGKIKL
ncbi:hypothetical protein CCY99_07310 [Helicobacter sp. 16-1353]|uniref:glycosyltransferase family 2 protein n=1 Tax=Helicobacter sp. 16-1353 TaxID=2004996 RepID=UPI000DCDBEA8|nr:glycosyltransferase family 2 protein [Helicobacter sp. 16-1353]RAX52450.1 hypothetical protein CCY99_07310 [Helicobacter sp. 16-1353]